MVKTHTEIIRVRLPKAIRAQLELEAELHKTDMSKLVRRCVSCFVRQSKCYVKRELVRLQKEGVINGRAD